MNVKYFGDFFGLGTPELIIILVILLLLFGGKKLPELSRSLGSSIKELKKGVSGDDSAKKSSTSSGSDSTNQ